MSTEDDADLAESWIEVTPQILGYQPFGIAEVDQTSIAPQQPPYTDLGSFHTNVEDILLTRLLTEAQEHPDLGLGQVAPPSPPPSRECLTPAELGDLTGRQPLPPDALLYAAALKASSLTTPVTMGPGEWASRPEVGGFLPIVDRPDLSESPSSSSVKTEHPITSSFWSIRHSAVMKSRMIAWLIDHVPSLISHAATFLLGAATMLFLLRKRINWPKGMTHLPLD